MSCRDLKNANDNLNDNFNVGQCVKQYKVEDGDKIDEKVCTIWMAMILWMTM